MIYLSELIILVMVYIILVLSSSILTEFTGLINFLPAALFGLVAFLYPIIFKFLPMHFLLIPIMLVGVLILGLIIWLSSYKYNTNYLAVLSFGLIAGYTTLTLTPQLPWPILLGVIIGAVLIVIICLFTTHLISSPFGENLTLIKKDELSTQLFGKNISLLKFESLLFSSFLAGIAGILFAITYTGELVYNPFIFSLLFFAVILFAGQNILGNLLGIVLIAVLPEFLGLTSISLESLYAVKEILFSLVIIIFLFFKPQGLFTRKHLIIKPVIIQPKIIKKKKESPREQAKRIAKEKQLSKKERNRLKKFREAQNQLLLKQNAKENKLKVKQRNKLEKQLLKEQKKKQKEILRNKTDQELDKFEDKIRGMELKKEKERERSLRGETLFEKGFRFLKDKEEKTQEYIKKKMK